ncbi:MULTISPECIES: ParB/RepB/Spo0J family partition protein [Limosilactobacillus]|jgi:ParB family chromosome partitioning protein|uniref:ParB/RepB/Spo0J family partition protein n=1 Tax=Limosilactobacillus portuensis TaxID=2742601 RepID=A0ABS6IT94_9LACO|nr:MULTISPECIES: ParB/RepB/Spo0J family partition protein [Limosilactobacillus]MDU1505036.1 ParB/RepB/Spo0J family partition protein [Limosilactobacillus vaginalis]PMC27889.1 chromosome partitioning protein ParB [Gardnerella vaginalis]MBD8087612.1 ParB/RepB/Spo0J family partition protein [Limosilactobacillus portuensis]MBU9694533.1 ParB/RepB/Spo0J family partition protein [Limosilactobacillus portuensis]MEC4742072.1 ParB/RepB/Spo0J family partition protein [Limosilactobacillus sp. c10Ua_36]
MAKNKQSGLGRGIEALFEENDFNEISDNETVQDVKLSLIRPNPYQPRRTFDQKALRELASSIQESGVFQPIILRQPDPKLKRYELIAGERRFRASKLAKQTTIPAIIRTMSDEKMMEVAVLENLQREDLTPLEEAQAYQTLMDKLSLTQAQVAERLGKSRPYIANYLRLLGLPNEIKELVSAGKLSMGQARTLLGLKDRKQLVKLAKQAVEKNLTVRQLEELVSQMNGTAEKKRAKRRQRKPAYVREAESQLQSKFGTKVAVAPSRKKNAGKIEIPYTSADDFNRILEVLNISLD